MKRLLAVMLVLVMIMTTACSKKGEDETVSTPTPEPTQTVTQAPTAEPTPEPTVEPTEEPTAEPTEEPSPEPTEEPAEGNTEEKTDYGTDAKELYNDNYDSFVGTWYLYSGEVEGDEWLAQDTGDNVTVNFYYDFTANRFRDDGYSDPENGNCFYYRNEDSDKAFVIADYFNSNNEYLYSMTEDNELQEDITLYYEDGTIAGATLVYTKTPYWEMPGYEGTLPGVRAIPDEIQSLIDTAEPNAWLVTIADPSPELSAALNDAGWELDDETGNEWVKCPWNNPKELIIANAYYRPVEIEIHEPKSDYDPSTSENEWEAGPFMYYAHLEPGELCRFIVDMPDEKKDATMCMYMTFGDDEFDYYLRIFKYDAEDPYVLF